MDKQPQRWIASQLSTDPDKTLADDIATIYSKVGTYASVYNQQGTAPEPFASIDALVLARSGFVQGTVEIHERGMQLTRAVLFIGRPLIAGGGNTLIMTGSTVKKGVVRVENLNLANQGPASAMQLSGTFDASSFSGPLTPVGDLLLTGQSVFTISELGPLAAGSTFTFTIEPRSSLRFAAGMVVPAGITIKDLNEEEEAAFVPITPEELEPDAINIAGITSVRACLIASANAGTSGGGGEPTTGRYLLYGIGDSITQADQSGGPSTSHAALAAGILNESYPDKFDFLIRGYPSKTAGWYQRNQLPYAFADVDFALYDKVFIFLAFGANDLVYPDGSDSVQPIDVAAKIKQVALALQAVNPKVEIILEPTFDRGGYPEFDQFNIYRQGLNHHTITARASFALAASNIYAQPVGLDDAPLPVPNSLFTDGSHLTLTAQTQVATEDARSIARILSLSLPGGVGTEPVAPPLPSVTPGDGSDLPKYWKHTQNTTEQGNGILLKTSGNSAWDAHGTYSVYIPGAYAIGAEIDLGTVTRYNGVGASLVGFSIGTFEPGLISIRDDDFALYWDNTHIRVFNNLNGIASSFQTDFNTPTSTFKIKRINGGFEFYRDGVVMYTLNVDYNGNLYINASLSEPNISFIPDITVTADRYAAS